MPGIVIDAGNTAVNKAEESLPLSNIYILVGPKRQKICKTCNRSNGNKF